MKVVNDPITLSDLTLSANVQVEVGSSVPFQSFVSGFHPVSEEYVVARQGDSDTFMASVHINNTDVMEVLAGKYVMHMKEMGKKISNPFMSSRFSQG